MSEGEETPQYRRRAGEHATYLIPKYDALDFGDIVDDADAFRATQARVVVGGSLEPVENIGQGSGMIGVEISRRIEDPIEFYGPDPPVDICRINLDAVAHAALLRRATGGRPVHASREVYAERGDGRWDLMIMTPKSLDLGNGRVSTSIAVELSKKTPDVYLADVAELDLDPTMEAQREKNRAKHDETAKIVRVGCKGMISISTSHSSSQESVEVLDVDRNENGAAIEILAKDESTGRLMIYRRRIISPKYGPYGGVPVWVADIKRPTIPSLNQFAQTW